MVQSFRSLDGGDAGPLEGEQLAKALEHALGESQTDPEVSALDLVGWFALRSSAGLHTGDIEFHNAHFRRPKDLALILRSQPDGDVLLEFYSRAKTPRLSPEQHRWGALRLSTDVPVLGPIEVTMRPAIGEEELTTLESLDRALEGEQRKSRRGRAQVKLVGGLRPRQLASGSAVPVYEANALSASGIPALLIPKKRQLWLAVSAIFVSVFAISAGVCSVFFLMYGPHAETRTPKVIGLQADPQRDQVLLTWDRNNPFMRAAKTAILHIEDGAQHRDVRLDGAQINHAAVLYRPQSDDVTFRLEVRGKQGSPISESVRVLDAASRTPLDLTTAAEAQTPVANPALPPTGHREPNPAPSPKLAPLPDLPSPNAALLSALEAGIAKAWEHRINLAHPAVSNPPAPEQPPATPVKKSPPPVSIPTSTQADVRPKIDSEEPALRNQPAAETPQLLLPLPPAPVPSPPVQPPAPVPARTTPPTDFKPPRPIRQVVPDTSAIPPGLLASSPQVKVLVKIDKEGNVTDAQIVSDGTNMSEPLTDAALRAARFWTFEPATLGRQSVASEHTIVFQFRPLP